MLTSYANGGKTILRQSLQFLELEHTPPAHHFLEPPFHRLAALLE